MHMYLRNEVIDFPLELSVCINVCEYLIQWTRKLKFIGVLYFLHKFFLMSLFSFRKEGVWPADGGSECNEVRVPIQVQPLPVTRLPLQLGSYHSMPLSASQIL